MSGVVAAIVFPLMRTLQPTLATYPNYEGDHAMLTGGLVASRVFFTVDVIQFVCAGLALLTLIVMVGTGYKIHTIARLLRIMVLCATMALLSYHLFLFMPKLTMTLQGYWDMAAAGNTLQADQFKDRFLDSHAAASRILGTITMAVFINIILVGWTLTAEPKETSAQ